MSSIENNSFLQGKMDFRLAKEVVCEHCILELHRIANVIGNNSCLEYV